MTATTPNFRRHTPRQQASEPVPPTEAQTKFINSLLEQIHDLAPEVATRLRDEMRASYVQHTLTKGSASRSIDLLKNQLKDLQNEGFRTNREARRVKSFADDRPEVPAGRYAVDNEDGQTAFYRVSVADDGRIFVRVYSSDQTQPLPWKQSLTVLRKIEKAGLTESAIRFGQEFQICGVCGRGLTDPESRAAGIGPVCLSKLSQ